VSSGTLNLARPSTLHCSASAAVDCAASVCRPLPIKHNVEWLQLRLVQDRVGGRARPTQIGRKCDPVRDPLYVVRGEQWTRSRWNGTHVWRGGNEAKRRPAARLTLQMTLEWRSVRRELMASWPGMACQQLVAELQPCRDVIWNSAYSDDRLTSFSATLISSRPWPYFVIDALWLKVIHRRKSVRITCAVFPVGLISCAALSFHLSFPIKLRTNNIVYLLADSTTMHCSAGKCRQLTFHKQAL